MPVDLRFVAPDLRRLDALTSEIAVASLFVDDLPPRGLAGLFDYRLAGLVSRLRAAGRITAARGEVVMLPLRPKMSFDKALVLGLGERASFDEVAFRASVASLVATLEGLCARSAVVELPGRASAAIGAERAVEIVLDETREHPTLDEWTLVEDVAEQRKLASFLSEHRHRVRRGLAALRG